MPRGDGRLGLAEKLSALGYVDVDFRRQEPGGLRERRAKKLALKRCSQRARRPRSEAA